ncbi:hypothetical protein [Bacillus phage PK16]|nr:hypothetical protein [Bacillus phage PK16]AUM58953.1 hypothetical protein BCP01_152 [Bacillus phage BCP01]
MPTTWTQGIVDKKDHTGKDFLIRFSKSRGELRHMESKPTEAYPEFRTLNVQNYHDNIKALQDELDEINSLGEWGLKNRWSDSNQEEQLKFNGLTRRDYELRKRYDKIIEDVKAWEPHTDSLKKLQKDAIEHLEYVREYDCRPEDWRETESNLYKPILFLTPEEWKEATVKSLEEQISFNKKQLAEEIARTHKDNLFISDLISSLEGLGQ